MGLLQLQPFKVIGEAIEKTGPEGAAIVSGVKTGIEIVKNTKLQLGDVLRDSGAAAIDAAAARVVQSVNDSRNVVLGQKIQSAFPIILGIGLLILFMRRKH